MEPAGTIDVVVAGTGPAGLTAALAAAHAGFSVHLIGPAVNSGDRRTTALMVPALHYMESLGVLGPVEARAAPLRTMRIVDATRRLIRSPVVTFHASEIGESFFGLNIPNRYLNDALAKAVAEHPGIEWHETFVERWEPGSDRVRAILPDGKCLSAALAIAADGRLSPAREAAGISTYTHPYPQAALVLNFTHTRPHGFISTEFHTETGPFTQVPLPGDRSSLVWVVRPETADELMALDDEALSRRAEERMQSMLGRVTVEPGRQVYPLSATLPRRFARNRIALVGEAAHVFPPIGAQGLNLGIRDIQQLIEIAATHRSDPGAEPALSAYDRARRPDILARSGAVGLLNQSLLSNLLPAQILRSAGLSILGGFAPLRALFMREGLKPGSGLAAIGDTLRSGLRPHYGSH